MMVRDQEKTVNDLVDKLFTFILQKADDEGEDSSDEEQDIAPAPLDMFEEVQKLAELFPFTSKTRSSLNKLELLETFLPSMDAALRLCTSYVDHATFFFRPIKRDELFETLLPAVYNAAAGRRAVRLDVASSPGSDLDESHSNMKRSTPHALASLYLIFALGALLDLERPPFNADAERFCDLGRAGLSLRSVYESANMDTVQAMGLMATYHTLAGKKYSRDSAVCKNLNIPFSNLLIIIFLNVFLVVYYEFHCQGCSKCTFLT